MCSASGASESRPETRARPELDLFVNVTKLALNIANCCIGGYLSFVQPHHLLRPLVLHARTLERERVAVAAIGIGAVPEIVDEGVTGFYTSSADDFTGVALRTLGLDRRRVRERGEARYERCSRMHESPGFLDEKRQPRWPDPARAVATV